MSHLVSVRHNFETAHRLPHLGGKCRNLHGHSWWVEVTVAAPTLTDDHTVVEFGTFKGRLRTWIDTRLDHGAMLGAADPLLPALLADGSKTFVFGAGHDFEAAAWPTVEAVALLLADRTRRILADLRDVAPGAYVAQVRVQETHVNSASWEEL